MIPEAARKYIYHEEKDIVLLHGDCREVMAEMEPASIDTIISDPPYGLEFMGKEWDKAVPGTDFWKPALEVCKPGAMLMAFGGTRLYHRMTCAIEDAGWEIRDCLMWLYGSGFPKSHDISKAIDKAAGAEREVVGVKETGKDIPSGKGTMQLSKNTYEKEGKTVFNITAPATEPAKQWNGWGTALKPAWEPIVLAMKPLDGTFAENALKHGVAGLNIDGGRIKGLPWKWGTMTNIKGGGYGSKRPSDGHVAAKNIESNPKGRWPANLILDEDTAVMLDEQSGNVGGKWGKQGKNQPKENKSQVPPSTNEQMIDNEKFIGDSGGASRFFYIAKPSRSDRGNRDDVEMPLFDAVEKGFNNNHPTVKPTLLIQRLIELYMYLVKLTATPTGGIILDPFGGSGTTAVTAKQLGRKCIIIEIESKYLDITIERLRQGVLL